MADTTFRTKIESTETKPLADVKNISRGSDETTTVDVPYTDYQQEHSHPYSVDHFKLGSTWSDDVGGFPKEIARIESYIKSQIDRAEIANSITAVQTLLKEMEKFNNLSKEERAVVKIEVLSNYVEFLQKNEQVKSNLRKYANS